jgi:hypothetical protein
MRSTRVADEIRTWFVLCVVAAIAATAIVLVPAIASNDPFRYDSTQQVASRRLPASGPNSEPRSATIPVVAAHGHDAPSQLARASASVAAYLSAPRAIGSTADDWWRVSKVGRSRAGTLLPESFDLSVAGQKFTVHPNATKHMAEYATSHGGGSVPISSLAGSVESAVRGGLESGRNFIRVGAWELGIDTRGNVIHHAVYLP